MTVDGDRPIFRTLSLKELGPWQPSIGFNGPLWRASPGRFSGAWVFKGTRLPVANVAPIVLTGTKIFARSATCRAYRCRCSFHDVWQLRRGGDPSIRSSGAPVAPSGSGSADGRPQNQPVRTL
jgi:hypothetical protein